MRILVIESEPAELLDKTGQSHARNFGVELQRLDGEVEIDIAAPYACPLDHISLAQTAAVVFPGAGVAWSADDPRAAPLRQAMEAVFEQGLPCFGSCMGLQLAAVILGGRVETRPPELGIAKAIRITADGLAHRLMAGRQAVFSAPAIHADQVVELPRGASLLAGNDACPTQAFACEFDGIDFWGVEYHPEISAANIGHYIGNNEDKFADAQDLVADLLAAETCVQAAARLGTTTDDMAWRTRTIELRNWLEHVKERLV